MIKRTSLLTMLGITIVTLAFASFVIGPIRAEDGYSIEHISHRIQVMYNGYVLINDTVTLNSTGYNQFLIGYPEEYGSQIVKCIAYSGSDYFPATLNVPLENRVGFYGVRVDFPNGSPQVFTVEIVLPNSFLKQETLSGGRYTLSFPAYPSLTQSVKICNSSVVLPDSGEFVSGTTEGFVYSQTDLTAFTYLPANVTFTLSAEKLQLLDIPELDREIRINEFNEIEGADTYRITNRMPSEASFIEIFLPVNATGPQIEDQFGRRMADPVRTNQTLNRFMINFTIGTKEDQSTMFKAKYLLPSDFIVQKDARNFALNVSMFQFENYFIEHFSVTLYLPEGAKIQNLAGDLTNEVSSIERSMFKETVIASRQGVITSEALRVDVDYRYDSFWLSFRPTLWVSALTALGSLIIIASLKRPKRAIQVSVPTIATKLRPEHFRSFIEAYDEKRKIASEMESLEQRVQKGKIPRRRYKVRMKMLEARLDSLARNLTEFKERVRVAGGQYAALMVQLEVAESEISEVGANLKNAENLHARGELSLEAYRSRMTDYQRRKGNAETAINGILLRLREETR